MITINLLPQEERETAPASTARILSAVASVVVVIFAFIFYATTHYFDLPQAQVLLQNSKDDLKKLHDKKITQTFNQVNTLTAILKKREDAIEHIRLLKSEMTRKLLEWGGIFNEQKVWAEQLKVEKVEERGGNVRNVPGRGQPVAANTAAVQIPEYKWQYKVISSGNQLKTAFDYYRSLQNNEKFWKDFIKIKSPEYVKQEFDEKKWTPAEGYEFGIEMVMKLKREEKKEDE